MNSAGLITMNERELLRQEVIARVCRKELKQRIAAKRLRLSLRQIKRLCRLYRKEGARGIISKRRGLPSNNRFSRSLHQQIIELARGQYEDFGPTFMMEKLLENHDIKISKECLRQLLIAEKIWEPKCVTRRPVHPQRERRPCRGELVQIDGSPHDWFEGRGPKCCLIVFIDDATSEVLYLRFEPVETTQAYFRGLYAVIKTYGLPLGLYSDRHGIFRVNQGELPEAKTQFGRACEQLNIEIINAHSPQAKGRVERSNQTHQDRLVKELRLANISDITAANIFIEDYRPKHNERFAKIAKEPQKAFIENTWDEPSLLYILSEQERRKVSKNLEISFRNKVYQIQAEGKGRRLQQANVIVCQTMGGEIILLYQERQLSYKVFSPQQKRPQIVDEKCLNALCDEKFKLVKSHKPKPSHPWKRLATVRLTSQFKPGNLSQAG